MNNKLFRQKSLDQVTSPEQLQDYIQVSNPSVWMILAAVAVLLVGVCVWGVFGQLDTSLELVGWCEEGVLTLCLPQEQASQITPDSIVMAQGQEFAMGAVSANSYLAADLEHPMLELVLRSGFRETDYVCVARVPCGLADGVYSVTLVLERVAPMSFILN